MSAFSGVKTVVSAGTAEKLGSMRVNCSVAVKALTTNTDLVYVGNVDDDVSSSNGFPLSAGDVIIFDYVTRLDNIWVDATVNNEGVAWILLRL